MKESNQDIMAEAFGEWKTLTRDLSISRVVDAARDKFDIELSEVYANQILKHYFNSNLTLREMRGPVGDMTDDEVANMIQRFVKDYAGRELEWEQ